ncbi:MAG: hypothetical protein RIC55_08055 [Pirellulaceae bacterium]
MSAIGHIDVDAVKAGLPGRTREVLRALAPEFTEAFDNAPNHVRCPLPGHEDTKPSFRFDDTEAGKSICNCGSRDVFALLMDAKGWTFIEAAAQIGDVLGVVPANGKPQPKVSIIEQVERAKNIPIGWLAKLGATEAKRGKATVCRLPVFNTDKEPFSYFDLMRDGKGLFKKGKGNGGPTVPHDDEGNARFPEPGDTVLFCEGAKDEAALLAEGHYVIGLPGRFLSAGYVRWFAGCHVVLVPDRDKDGLLGANKSAARLAGTAASVRIAHLPLELKEKHGEDVRDLLKKPNGRELLKAAIDEAQIWTPSADEAAKAIASQVPENMLTNCVILKTGDGTEMFPVPMQDIIDRTLKLNGDFPRRVGPDLFTQERDQIVWLPKADNLFGWLHGHVSGIEWYNGPSCVTKNEFHSRLEQCVRQYAAASDLPHFPPYPGIYYSHSKIVAGSGDALREFVRFFAPETTADVDLIEAFVATAFWGGPGGSRPMFAITSDHGRGVGKTTLIKKLGRLHNGYFDFSKGEDIEKIKKRLLTPEAAMKTIVLIDNVKTRKFSWGEMEALITSSEISGYANYRGERVRPNVFTWAITLNGPALSKDFAQRVVNIKLVMPTYSDTWDEDIDQFIDTNRAAIIADIAALFERPSVKLNTYSRWGAWERAVLSRTAEPNEAQQVILERRAKLDADAESDSDLEDHVAEQLRKLGYDTDTAWVHIPTARINSWYHEATGCKPHDARRHIEQSFDEGSLRRLKLNPSNREGRGVLWMGTPESKSVQYDIEERISGRVSYGF